MLFPPLPFSISTKHLPANSEVDPPRCAGAPSFSQACPNTWSQPGPPKLPPLILLPPSSSPPGPPARVQLPGAAGAQWHRWRVIACRSKCSMKSQSILADHSPSPLLLLASCTHFTPLRLPLLCISQLLGCPTSLSSLWAVTSTSMKHWCLSKGEILESHFLSKHSC